MRIPSLSSLTMLDIHFSFSLSHLTFLLFFLSIRLLIICFVASVQLYIYIYIINPSSFFFFYPLRSVMGKKENFISLIYKIFRHRIFNRPKKRTLLVKKNTRTHDRYTRKKKERKRRKNNRIR